MFSLLSTSFETQLHNHRDSTGDTPQTIFTCLFRDDGSTLTFSSALLSKNDELTYCVYLFTDDPKWLIIRMY